MTLHEQKIKEALDKCHEFAKYLNESGLKHTSSWDYTICIIDILRESRIAPEQPEPEKFCDVFGIINPPLWSIPKQPEPERSCENCGHEKGKLGFCSEIGHCYKNSKWIPKQPVKDIETVGDFNVALPGVEHILADKLNELVLAVNELRKVK